MRVGVGVGVGVGVRVRLRLRLRVRLSVRLRRRLTAAGGLFEDVGQPEELAQRPWGRVGLGVGSGVE